MGVVDDGDEAQAVDNGIAVVRWASMPASQTKGCIVYNRCLVDAFRKRHGQCVVSGRAFVSNSLQLSVSPGNVSFDQVCAMLSIVSRDRLPYCCCGDIEASVHT